jgi:hypothetical protein
LFAAAPADQIAGVGIAAAPRFEDGPAFRASEFRRRCLRLCFITHCLFLFLELLHVVIRNGVNYGALRVLNHAESTDVWNVRGLYQQLGAELFRGFRRQINVIDGDLSTPHRRHPPDIYWNRHDSANLFVSGLDHGVGHPRHRHVFGFPSEQPGVENLCRIHIRS